MNPNHLHIIVLDVPYQPDYGGAIDMFYRIKNLHKLGIKLTMHIFEYGRGQQKELEKYGEVIYYKRKVGAKHLLSRRPFIVQSRLNQELLNNLRKDNDPVFMEGIHTAVYLEFPDIAKRITFVRMHNEEVDYYNGLAEQTTGWKRIFFRMEARKISRYMPILSKAMYLLAVREEDAAVFRKYNPNTHIVTSSIPDLTGTFRPVKNYALFHGNLSVKENELGARWIIETLKDVLEPNFPLIITGKKPGRELQKFCEDHQVQLIASPSQEQLDQLIQEAQLHVLYSPAATGTKQKLLNCLHSSGQVLINDNMDNGTGLKDFCTVANSSKEWKIHFIGLKNKPLTLDEYNARTQYLDERYSTYSNCKEIQSLILSAAKHDKTNHL